MLVLDANILVRAVLGTRVRNLLGKYGDGFDFAAPDVAFQEAEEHLPQVLKARNLTPDPFMSFFASLVNTIQAIDREAYSAFETVARQRLTKRDEEDWPVLATALTMDCPIWTEDTDFFGCGVAIWTTDRVELYLSKSKKED